MPDTVPAPSEYDQVKLIDLKNPLTAGILSWLIPGWGHYYQGRTAKAVLYFLCIVPTFIVGCILGSSRETGVARNVYYSWRYPDRRYWAIPQSCMGIAAIPAGIQALQVRSGQVPLFGRLMAPPELYDGDRTGIEPTLDTIMQKLPYFELGTYLTMIAALMNLLVIFDAVDGPLVYRKTEP
jgi:hypothetical protein